MIRSSHHRRRRLVASLALLAALLAVAPGAAAGGPPLHPAGLRLIEVQRELEVITAEKRLAYARSLVAERRLFAARRALAGARLDVARTARLRDPALQAQGARWSRLVLTMTEDALAEARSRFRRLDAMGRAFREEIKEFFRPLHDLIRGALADVGASRRGWNRVWPIPLLPDGPIRACPVAGPWSLTGTFGAPRPGGRTHAGNDILAAWGTPVVAAHDGVALAAYNLLGGRAVVLRGSEGYTYYAHLSGYAMLGTVRAGDVIGFVGNSGNARGRIHHVHFEWHPGGGPGIDPYRLLLRAC